MKTVIVEDEGVAARRLQKMLEAQGLEIIGHCKSNKEILDFLSKNKEPDLFFMDIHLNDGVVFDALQQVEIKAPIIFTTAYDQYAIKAFKQNSVDYLLKPIDKEDLQNAIEKFKKIYKKEETPSVDIQAIAQLLSASKITKEFKKRYTVKVGDHLKSIPVDDITLFYSEQKITFLRTAEKRSYPIENVLDKILPNLDSTTFFRVNRSHIVNINYIADIIAYSNSRLKINVSGAEKQEIIVARDRVKAFKTWLG